MSVRSRLRYFKKYIQYSLNPLENKRNYVNRPAIFLFGEPEYNNLGDHAIAYATRKYIEKEFHEYEYIGISEDEINYNLKNVKKIVKSGDLILLQGGGNMGDIYPDQVSLRKKILCSFKNNEIIVMPQTIHFSDPKGKLPDYYDAHKSNCTLVAREKESFYIMRNQFRGNVLLVPDMVLYLSTIIRNDSSVRKGALICLRDDKEKGDQRISYDYVAVLLRNRGLTFERFSTVIRESVKICDRNQYLESIINKISTTKFIVTDRLHAMIFAAITKTPCVVIPTFNHKVAGSYEWIKHLNYIKFCKNCDELLPAIDDVCSINEKTDINIVDKYDPLTKLISKKLKSGDSL